MQIDNELFKDAMRRTASGVSILTSQGQHGRAGLTVSTLQSLSLDPPSVMGCIHAESKSLSILLANAHFVASILAADQQDIATAFAKPTAITGDGFPVGEWVSSPSGAMILRGALCNFTCKVATVFAFGSHKIVVGQVLEVCSEGIDPLIYSDRSYRRLSNA